MICHFKLAQWPVDACSKVLHRSTLNLTNSVFSDIFYVKSTLLANEGYICFDVLPNFCTYFKLFIKFYLKTQLLHNCVHVLLLNFRNILKMKKFKSK